MRSDLSVAISLKRIADRLDRVTEFYGCAELMDAIVAGVEVARRKRGNG